MAPLARDRAVVLGGGGVTGIAWEIGMLAGLARAGVEIVAAADMLIGTSAGSTVAAQISSSTSVTALYHRILDGRGAPEPVIDLDVRQLVSGFAKMMTEDADADRARARIGELALAEDRVPEAERRRIIDNRLPSHAWPEHAPKLWITAVDASNGRFRVFDRDSGVELVDAVAASCAIPVVWPAVTIGESRYFDGSFRSATNLDLAKGFARVLVLQPMDLGATSDVGALDERSVIQLIQPDTVSADAMADILDPAAARRSASEGYRQGQQAAAEVAKFWIGNSAA